MICEFGGFRGDVRADDGLGRGYCRTGIFWGIFVRFLARKMKHQW